MNVPRATYRLQLNKDFTLRHALARVPYLDTLGVSHVYLSPVLKAQPGSTHGYDTVDHRVINPELGTLEDFRALAGALKLRGMGIILDFVPNHMGVGGADNALWLEVLRHGPASRFENWFDIDWHAPRPGLEGKLLVPFLGKAYPQVLADGDICLKADGEGFAVWAYDKEKLPIRPEDAAALLEEFGSAEAVIAAHGAAEALDVLIAKQHWRLAHFATAGDEINYRRFFINSELGGIRIDRDEVFVHAHRLIFELIEEELVEGLRIDHVDGLLDPKGYLEMLRAKAPRPIYLVIEKILAPHEDLRADWPVEGTTGYEIGAQLTRVLTQGRGEAAVSAAYEDFVGEVTAPHEEAYRCKLRVMDNELAVELATLARLTARLAWSVPRTVDLTELALRRVWREILAQLEVYRTYVDARGVEARDRRELGLAIGRARLGLRQVQPAVFDFVEALVLGELAEEYDAAAVAVIVGQFQQYSGPVMAKGLEDTALYRYNRLMSLNEVGAHPDRFSVGIEAFHDSNRRRLAGHPHCMIATSTHDTKRGEDIRLIISAIADAPEHWAGAVGEWRAILGEAAEGIHANDLYLFFQLLLGGWPIVGESDDLAARIKGAMEKSLREARERSDWAVNDGDYEGAVSAFVDAALAHEGFLAAFHPVREVYVAIGRRKAAIETALKFTIPGVPDIYRGAEDWEQSFVDPDNRRPLDFAALERRLGAPEEGRDDKIVVTQALLRVRREYPALFSEGAYEPIDAGKDVLAFRRRLAGVSITVLADLSPSHESGFAEGAALGKTIVGSHMGPVWVTLDQE